MQNVSEMMVRMGNAKENYITIRHENLPVYESAVEWCQCLPTAMTIVKREVHAVAPGKAIQVSFAQFPVQGDINMQKSSSVFGKPDLSA